MFQLTWSSGAKWFSRGNLDFMEACRLVDVWDDARLEKLMVIVLTTDDDWISQTERSFRVFAAKSAWADERLCAWEKANKVSA